MSKESTLDPLLPFKEEDLEEILKAVSFNKSITLDRGSRRILM